LELAKVTYFLSLLDFNKMKFTLISSHLITKSNNYWEYVTFDDSIPIVESHLEISGGKFVSVRVSSISSVFSFSLRNRRTRLLAADRVKGWRFSEFCALTADAERPNVIVGEQDPRETIPERASNLFFSSFVSFFLLPCRISVISPSCLIFQPLRLGLLFFCTWDHRRPLEFLPFSHRLHLDADYLASVLPRQKKKKICEGFCSKI